VKEEEDMAKKKQPAPGPTPAVGDLIDAHVREGLKEYKGKWAHLTKTADFPTGRVILALERASQAAAVEALLDRLLQWKGDCAAIYADLEKGQVCGDHPDWREHSNRESFLRHALAALLRRKLPLDEGRLLRLLRWPVENMDDADRHLCTVGFCLPGLTTAAENFAAANGVSPRVRTALKALIRTLRRAYDRDAGKYADRLQALLPAGR
jgi:hypothetical protein